MEIVKSSMITNPVLNSNPSSFILINAQLAVNYPAYTMVICKHWKFKTVDFYSTKFE